MTKTTKEKKPHWVLRFFLLYIAFIILYCSYLYFFMDVRITKAVNVQENYGQYLIDTQDKMVEYSLEFASLVEDVERVYTEKEKEAIKEELIKQNELLKELQINSPDSTNEDYLQIYTDILKIFSFYIQGETMQAEYVYAYKDNYIPDEKFSDKTVRLETYTMGTSLCNMMGNMMLNNYTYINDVRNTNYESKFEILPVEDLQSYLEENISEEKRNELLQRTEIEDIIENVS